MRDENIETWRCQDFASVTMSVKAGYAYTVAKDRNDPVEVQKEIPGLADLCLRVLQRGSKKVLPSLIVP